MDSHLPFGAPDSPHGATARRLRIAKTFAPVGNKRDRLGNPAISAKFRIDLESSGCICQTFEVSTSGWASSIEAQLYFHCLHS